MRLDELHSRTVGGAPRAAYEASLDGGPALPSHHSPFFQVDAQGAVTTGVRAMTSALLTLLGPAEPEHETPP